MGPGRGGMPTRLDLPAIRRPQHVVITRAAAATRPCELSAQDDLIWGEPVVRTGTSMPWNPAVRLIVSSYFLPVNLGRNMGCGEHAGAAAVMSRFRLLFSERTAWTR